MDKKNGYKVTIENAESEKYAKAILEELKKLQKQGESIDRKKEVNEYGGRQSYSNDRREERDKRYDAVEVDYQKLQKFYELGIPRKDVQVNRKDEVQEDSGWISKIYNFVSSFLTTKETVMVEGAKSLASLGNEQGEKPWILSDDDWNHIQKTYDMHDMEDDIDFIKGQLPIVIEEYEKQLAIYHERLSDKLGEQIQTFPEMIKESIDTYTNEDPNWEFSEDANELYALYFKKRREQYEGNAEEIQKIQEEEAEHQRKLLENSTQIQKEIQEQSQASRLEAEKQKIQRDQELLQEEIANRTEASNKMGNIETQKSDEILEAKTNATLELIGVDNILVQNNKKIEETEAESLKNRAEQWKEYAEKVSAISQQISEVTGMVTSSLGGMFGQLAESYSQQVEELTNKISALDEEKEAALERVSLSEEERSAKEEELAQQKINLEYATTEEQKNKADERIATLQGELGAEDSINRDFESKKASLEKEKEKKEKAQNRC